MYCELTLQLVTQNVSLAKSFERTSQLQTKLKIGNLSQYKQCYLMYKLHQLETQISTDLAAQLLTLITFLTFSHPINFFLICR